MASQPHTYTPTYSQVHSNGRAGLLGDTLISIEEVAAQAQETTQGGRASLNGHANHRDTHTYRQSYARRRSQRRSERAKEIKEELLLKGVAAPTGMEKEWYTLAEAALILGRSEWTIGQWCREGKLAAEKHPYRSGGGLRPWRISSEEIARYRLAGLRDVCHCRNS